MPGVRSFRFGGPNIQIDLDRESMDDAALEMKEAAAAVEDAAKASKVHDKMSLDDLRHQLEASERAQQETVRQLRRAEQRLRNTYGAQASQVLVPGEEWTGVASASASGDAYTLTLPGLRLTKVGDDLAEYFGDGSERGLLVLEAGEPWTGVRTGDVLLSVNGNRVRQGDVAALQFDSSRDNMVEVLRKGTRTTVEIPRSK
jgi:hypothetical protein